MKLGLIGGTFNPIHLAHLRIAEEAREAAELDHVLFIPSADPPHKVLAGNIGFRLRYEMVQQALNGYQAFSVTDIESRLGGKSYTVNTLPVIRAEHPSDDLYFIIGSDSFLELGLWRCYAKIFGLTSLVVVERPGMKIQKPLQSLPDDVQNDFIQESETLLRHKSNTTISFVQGVNMDISSSSLRDLLRDGRSIRYLVPIAVEEYIVQKGLYLK